MESFSGPQLDLSVPSSHILQDQCSLEDALANPPLTQTVRIQRLSVPTVPTQRVSEPLVITTVNARDCTRDALIKHLLV